MGDDPTRKTRRKREVPTFGRGICVYSGARSNPVVDGTAQIRRR
jgi:hypothetical protein